MRFFGFVVRVGATASASAIIQFQSIEFIAIHFSAYLFFPRTQLSGKKLSIGSWLGACMLRSLSSVRRDVLSSDPVGFSDVVELYLVGESRYINSLL